MVEIFFVLNDKNFPQYRVGDHDVHHGHRAGLLERVAGRQVPDEPWREELQRLLLHVLTHDVHRIHRRNADTVQVRKNSKPLLLTNSKMNT